MHQSSSSHPSFRDHYFNLLITQQSKSSCHFLVLLTFDHLHSLMLSFYDNWVGVPLKFAVMTHMVHSRTSLRSWKRFCSGCKPDHRLITGLVQHLLVSYILHLLTLCLLHNRGNYNWLYGLHKLHFFGDIHS